MQINIGYALNELKNAMKAERLASGAADASNAKKRIRKWTDVLAGMEIGWLKIGTRKPTKYPVWATPEVARGGFATGMASATAPFSQEEAQSIGDLAKDLPHMRSALLLALLSDEGLAWMRALLASRKYRVEVPEDAALLTVAWLRGEGRDAEAESIVAEIAPYAQELRFAPKPADEPLAATDAVYRYSASDVRRRLENCKPNKKIAAHREALGVWIPYTDRLVGHWLEILDGAAVPAASPEDFPKPSNDWKRAAQGMLDEYRSLKESHTLCRKYHNKKGTLQILLEATRDAAGGNCVLSNRARHAVGCYIRAHGRPGDERFKAARGQQKREMSLPLHHDIAKDCAMRISESDSRGLDGSEGERLRASMRLPGLPAKICDIIDDGRQASMTELIRDLIIPSAQVLAAVAPQLAAAEIYKSFPAEHGDIAMLAAHAYRAFSRRRSLLLLDLSSQVRFDELPWVKPIIDGRAVNDGFAEAALRLAACALDFFPESLLPNPLVAQMNALYWLAGRQRLFLEELAADIFTGRFAPKFDEAALSAGRLLRGSLYEKYYGIDYADFEALHAAASRLNKAKSFSGTALEAVTEEYVSKTAAPGESQVVYNVMQIEISQVYTTHNLAQIVAAGAPFSLAHKERAMAAFRQSARLLARALGEKKRGRGHAFLRAKKNAAYAWRHGVFFLSLLSSEDARSQAILSAKGEFCRTVGEDLAAALFRRLEGDEGAGPFLGWFAHYAL